jgi:hypothetical protein
MASRKSTAILKPVQAAVIKHWFQDVWPRRPQYPDERSCHQVALQINTIVDRHNARSGRSAAGDAIRQRRHDHLAAGRRARALMSALQRTMDNLLIELNTLAAHGLEPVDGALSYHISVTRQALAAVESFLALPDPPTFQDHVDPILWIADAVEDAWRDVPSGPKIPLGHRPEAALTSFVSQATEAIGLVSSHGTAFSLDTISDHLRERQNRRRAKRHGAPEVGEN